MPKKTTDYRLEVKELMAKINLPDEIISEKVGVKVRTLYRWRQGESSPQFGHIEALKQLAEGTLREPQPARGAPPGAISNFVTIPILGTIPAGTPQEAVEDKIGEIGLPPLILGSGWKDCYCLKVVGDSMSPDARDGDLVVIKKSKHPKIGDWVVARVDGDYTLKKCCAETVAGMIKPVNKAHQPIQAKEELKIEGVVIWIMKKP